MRRVLLPIWFFLLLTSAALAQSGWFQLRQQGEAILFSVDMYDATHITAVGTDGLILHTDDGGTTWTSPASGESDNLRRVRWHSPTLGVILGNGGVALKSVDGGQTWQRLGTGTTSSLFDVHFFDENTWMVIGQAARVITTTDGGQSWENKGSGTDNYNEIAIRGDFGVIVGNKGLIRVSTDGGKNWRNRGGAMNIELTGVSIGDDSTAVAVGANGTILRTQNRGTNWTPIIASVPISSYRLSGVRHLSRERVVLDRLYRGLILWSTDTGLNWYSQDSNTPSNLEALAFIDEPYRGGRGMGRHNHPHQHRRHA
jgi:photosystem II stability/assembly factor-like uncharacterized protein